MEHEGLVEMVMIAEDIRDGRRAEPFTREELDLLCIEMRRAIALLGSDDGESIASDE